MTFKNLLENGEPKETISLIEVAYPNNLGFHEMVKFYQTADDKKIAKMEKIIKKGDWGAFKKLIDEVLKMELK